ncbi:hypothetical protein Q3G72_013876 [Acer saccharum]|nr:hypothetical protein Q3G72_030581 [Acer saccharum]KAK1587528.1 hypothetical protein Q3G72_013876 [Acer saccharum]
MCEEDHRGPKGIKPRKNHARNPKREYLSGKEAAGTGEHEATEKTRKKPRGRRNKTPEALSDNPLTSIGGNKPAGIPPRE